MLTKRMRKVVEAIERLPAAEQDQLAATIEQAIEQPLITSDTVRPEVVRAFQDVITHSDAVLEYLKDK